VAVENANLKDQMDSLLQENHFLKNRILANANNFKPGNDRKGSWTFATGSSIGDRLRDKSSTVPGAVPAIKQSMINDIGRRTTSPASSPNSPSTTRSSNPPISSPPPSTVIKQLEPQINSSNSIPSVVGDSLPGTISPRLKIRSQSPELTKSPLSRDQVISMKRLPSYVPIEMGDDEEYDDEDIVLERNVSTGNIEVRGGTLLKLIERLSYHKVVGK
jgi:hypothetical protein